MHSLVVPGPIVGRSVRDESPIPTIRNASWLGYGNRAFELSIGKLDPPKLLDGAKTQSNFDELLITLNRYR
jgi:hypothetical protein